jgi:hypothetical protein
MVAVVPPARDLHADFTFIIFLYGSYRRLSFRKLKARLKAVGPAEMNGLIVLRSADDYASGNDLRVQASSAK